MSILDSATIETLQWNGQAVMVVILPVGAVVHRIFRHAGADWDPPPEALRTGRLDPPRGCRDAFSTLYTAESGITAAFEARALRMEAVPGGERPFIPEDDPALPPRRHVAHHLREPAPFVNFEDRPTALAFGLDPDALLDSYGSWQRAALAVHAELHGPLQVAGICHQSKHRGSNGWNFGFFHGRHESLLTRGTPSPLDLEGLLRAHAIALRP